MRTVSVLLLEGFDHDEVAVSVDGREAARRQEVTSSPLVGLAAEMRLEVDDGAADLTVALPSRGLESTTRIPDGDGTILIEVDGTTLTARPGHGREGAI